MRSSFEYSAADNTKRIDYLLASYAVATMMQPPEVATRISDQRYGWFAFNAELDCGIIGLVMQGDSVVMERHSDASSHRQTLQMSPEEPVHGHCSAADCRTSVVAADGLLSRKTLGYTQGVVPLWSYYDEPRIVSGKSYAVTQRRACTIIDDDQTIGLRLAALTRKGHIIHDQSLAVLAATKYEHYYF